MLVEAVADRRSPNRRRRPRTERLMLRSAASTNSCWAANRKGEPGAGCEARNLKEEVTTSGLFTVSQKADW